MCKNVVLNKHPGVLLVSDNEPFQQIAVYSYDSVGLTKMLQKAIYGLVLMAVVLDFFLRLY